jgi:ABC-type phosphate/phosphonate transport system substrate-binding protein
MVSIEEAMNDAIDKVLSRINNYWKSDLERGIQYKLVVNVSTDFDEDQVEEIQFAFMDAIETVAKSSKENIVTAQTMDYLLWCDPGKYDKSSKVYRYVKKAFKKAEVEGTLRKLNVNRKMVLLKVDYD